MAHILHANSDYSVLSHSGLQAVAAHIELESLMQAAPFVLADM